MGTKISGGCPCGGRGVRGLERLEGSQPDKRPGLHEVWTPWESVRFQVGELDCEDMCTSCILNLCLNDEEDKFWGLPPLCADMCLDREPMPPSEGTPGDCRAAPLEGKWGNPACSSFAAATCPSHPPASLSGPGDPDSKVTNRLVTDRGLG